MNKSVKTNQRVRTDIDRKWCLKYMLFSQFHLFKFIAQTTTSVEQNEVSFTPALYIIHNNSLFVCVCFNQARDSMDWTLVQ